jgi:hypothetical protein
MDKMSLKPHCDQLYSADGEFLESSNSQERDTATVILVIGDSRNLNYDMHYHEGRNKHKVQGLGDWNGFELIHGDLFVLDTSDEQPQFRHNFESYGRTFFKHSSKGIEEKKAGMSIGIVFRATTHLAEVQRDTGLVVLDRNCNLQMVGVKDGKGKKKDEITKTKERKMFEKSREMLVAYMAGETHPMNKKSRKNHRKSIDETKVRRFWKKCKDIYFLMSRMEEEAEEEAKEGSAFARRTDK